MGRDDEEYLSRDEVKARLSCLLKADLLRLRRIAELQAKKVPGCEPDDLLAEGLDRVISGARRWPRGLETAPFMQRVFGSVVSSKAKHAAIAGRYEVNVEVDQAGDVDFNNRSAEVGPSSDPVDRLYAQEMLEKVASKLAEDPDSLALALALGQGLTADETRTQFHMSQNQYDAARKRLRRVVNGLMTQEKTHHDGS